MVLSNGFFYERIQLDTINERFNKVPTAKEGDANGRGMILVLTENGIVKNTTGVSLLFKWEHTRIAGAQGLEDFEPLDLTKGEYIVTYPTEMNHEGYVKAEIRIIDNGKYAGSRNMKIQVEPSVGDDTAMESSNQFSALVTALLQVNSWNTTIDGKIVEWEDDMAATKQLYIDNMEEVESTYPQQLLSLGSQLAETEADILTTQNKLKPKTIKPIITFSWDDATIYDHNNILPLFNSKGIVGTTGVILDKIGTQYYMTKAQIEAMKNAGWEIASHSKTHSVSDFRTLSQEVLEVELGDSKKLLNDLGFGVKNFLIPYGFTNDNIAKTAAKYYRSMRVSGNGSTGSLNNSPIATFNVNSLQLGDSSGVGTGLDSAGNVIDSLEQWKYWVDQAVATNGWLVFISHSNNVVVNYDRMADLSALIDYIQSLNVDIMTIDEALDIFENQVDADKFKVGADGKVSGEYGKFRHAPADTVLNATPLNSIDVQQTTVNIITAGNSSGFIDTAGGSILTVKPDNVPGRAFQIGKPNDEKKPLQVRGFATDGTPGSWRMLENIVNHPDGTIASSHTPPSLVRYAINICYIPQANATGYPENVAGQLTAWFYNDYGACVEEYKIRNTDKVYTRYWSALTAGWSEWTPEYRTTSLTFDSLNASSLLTAFPFGISFLQITSGNSVGMPSAGAWLIETRRTSPNGFNHQYAHLYDTTITHKRVAKADGTWSAWVSVNV